jgi:hypothetical protein
MKKTILTLLCLLTFVGVKANNEPTLILEVGYTNQSDINKVKSFENDTNFCCYFEVKGKRSEDNVTRIIHKESGVVLGTFYGTPTKEMVLKIYQTQLQPDYIEYIVPKLVMMQSETIKQ